MNRFVPEPESEMLVTVVHPLLSKLSRCLLALILLRSSSQPRAAIVTAATTSPMLQQEGEVVVHSAVIPRANATSNAPRCKITCGNFLGNRADCKRALVPRDIQTCARGQKARRKLLLEQGGNTSSATRRKLLVNVGSDSNGGWNLSERYCYHLDVGLARAVSAIVAPARQMNVRAVTLTEMGAGKGCYALFFAHCGIEVVAAMDGATNVAELTGDIVAHHDLGKPVKAIADWVMSLEVAEHIPKISEAAFVSNLVSNARCGIILSWANKAQGGNGHVNCQDWSYVGPLMASRGFEEDQMATLKLRKLSHLPWFSQNIHVLRRTGGEDTFPDECGSSKISASSSSSSPASGASCFGGMSYEYEMQMHQARSLNEAMELKPRPPRPGWPKPDMGG